MTPDELKSILSNPAIAARNPHLQGSKPQLAPVRPHHPKEDGRKEKSQGRSRVVIESRRSRLCDPDNLYVKAILDAIRYAGLIADDSPEHIELTVKQTKVPKDEEMTVVTIENFVRLLK